MESTHTTPASGRRGVCRAFLGEAAGEPEFADAGAEGVQEFLVDLLGHCESGRVRAGSQAECGN